MTQVSLEELVQKAVDGDRTALEKTIERIKDSVYNLSLRMLLYKEDAKDATQEILVKVVTSLSNFKGESAFNTWVFRIASNYLLTLKGKKSGQFISTFKDYATLIDTGISDSINYTQNLGEQNLLEEEVKVSCTHGLLICLNQKSRMVYILGEILEFNSIEGGQILDISSENFRKSLSRSRTQIRGFLEEKCGIMNPGNRCRCKKKVDYLVNTETINTRNLQFAKAGQRSIDLIEKIGDIEKSAAIYRSTPQFAAPESILQKMKETLNNI